MQITKIEAAASQLKRAIRLFFEDEDPISAHTLAAAAHGILDGLGAEFDEGDFHGTPLKGTGSVLKNLPIGDDCKRDFLKALSEAQNFFKHGARDPGTILEFDSFQTETLLTDTYLMYLRLIGPLHEGHIFLGWTAVVHPHLIVEGNPWQTAAIKIRKAADAYGFPVDDKWPFRTLLDLHSKEP